MPGLRKGRPTALARIGAFVVMMSLAASIGVAAQHGTPVASPMPAGDVKNLPPAWLEFGPGGALIARVVVEGTCPSVALDGMAVPMNTRAGASAAFAVVSCEAAVPFGVNSAAIGDQTLPVPDGPINRIAVIGDTGCRLNAWEKNYQACNDPEIWPFARVAETVKDWRPDLVIHVGDYLYRESPCPEGMAGCEGSPYGDNWVTWRADFFAPATPLLGAAPWVVMRGNHEVCSRNPDGWFIFLDPRPYQSECQKYTEPYVAPLFGLTVAAIDSAEASDESSSPEETSEYSRQFDLLAELAPADSWLVTHRPVWGILEGSGGEVQVENAAYEAATGGSLKGDYAIVLSGHIHAAESIAFDEESERPAQIISGNAGTAFDRVATASPTAGELGDADIVQAETLDDFGFLTLVKDKGVWVATQRNETGEPQLECIIDVSEMICQPPLDDD